MKVVVITPFLNEEKVLGDLIKSMISQNLKPNRWILVNDGSTDNSENIIKKISSNLNWITLVNLDTKKEKRNIGGKIINAFNEGLKVISIDNYDIIMKLDADLILPKNYIKKICEEFINHPSIGICGGICFVKNNNKFKIEYKSNLDHVRGALKAYRKECFIQIGGLINKMGWDSIDEYKARFYNWEVSVIKDLIVHHLKETNVKTGHIRASFKNGVMLYTIRFDIPLLMTNVIKRSFWKPYIIQGGAIFLGYLYALLTREKKIVDKKLGSYIRQYRYNKIVKRFRCSKI